jgi:hypothetical protein
MSNSETETREPLPYRLVVPVVRTGEVGLVLTVCGVEWDGGYGHWALTAANGHRYVLPEGLHDWARKLDADVRRGLTRLPTVYAFSQQGGGLAARILSAAQSA